MIRMTAAEKRAWREREGRSYPIRDEPAKSSIVPPARRQTDFIALRFECPPSQNNALVNVPGRGQVKSRAYREWRERAAWQVEAQRPGCIVGPYQIKIAVRRTNLRRDLGNIEKLTSDLLVALGVLPDDRHAERIELVWSSEGEGVFVTASPAA